MTKYLFSCVTKTSVTIQLLFFVLLSNTVQGQWSVLDTDPRPLQDKKGAYLYQPFTKAEWEASNFAKPADMKWHIDARYGMFIHFGLNSYVKKDMSWPIAYNRKAPDTGHGSYPDSAWQKTWPSLFKLEKFNADEWVDIAKNAGMKYITIIAKHHDGFHMWDTKYSEFKITNTAFGRDYLKELIDACHRANMPVGIYYSQRDWYHPDYAPVDTNTIKRISNPPYYEALPGKKVVAGATHKKYIEYQFNVVEELLTKYGKIDIFWFDAVWWGNMFTADMWDAERLTRMVRKLQPHIIINNRTSLPGDFDTPEQRIGMYQQRHWESAMTMNGSWAFDPEPKIYPAKQLLRQILTAAAGNGNVLLSWGAHFNGEWDTAQKDTLLEIGSWLKKYGHAYYNTKGGPWMPVKNYGAVYKSNKVYLYVFDWDNDGLVLPAITGNTIQKADFVNIEEKINWGKNSRQILFTKPTKPDNMVTIIELTMLHPIKGVLKRNVSSLFSDPIYGDIAYTKNINAADWSSELISIDLKKLQNLTGIGLYDNTGKVLVLVSADGSIWKDAGYATEKTNEFSITSFVTGVEVPGMPVRFVRLKGNGNGKLVVYAK